MNAKILDGKKLADKILDELENKIKKINKQIELAIVLVGDDLASSTYVAKKEEIGKKLGIEVKIYKYPKEISGDKLKKEVSKISALKSTNGIIVQLPLPDHISTSYILNTIPTNKDVDVLSKESVGRLYIGNSPILPPTTSGIIKLLEEYKIGLKSKSVAVVGFGKLVGKPTSIVMAQNMATVFIINEFTKNKEKIIKQADIVISGVGKPNLITEKMIKKGAIVLDAGYHTSPDSLARGDVAPEVKKAASYITPVPGGVGPMTVAMLFFNLIQLSKNAS